MTPASGASMGASPVSALKVSEQVWHDNWYEQNAKRSFPRAPQSSVNFFLAFSWSLSATEGGPTGERPAPR